MNGRFQLGPGRGLQVNISQEEIINIFHSIFYASENDHSGPPKLYNGVPIHKHPGDMFNYQQILFTQKPDYIIECGAFQGGSTMFFADTLNLIGKGKIVSVDICEREERWYPQVEAHERTILIPGSSVAADVVAQVKETVKDGESFFVILDSLHTKAHVLAEMESYGPLLAKGNYMIVEDSNLNGHPLPPEWHTQTMQEGGPFEAVQEYMRIHHDFVVDLQMEHRFLFSYAPSGYLVKI
ncbi:MAG: cephalosporin hydroxylase family protein [Proteobacteria bacterium]|nr:cephalosporin hydroxylase family protein [Pseudomonadota bacterium]MBU0966349.1 cephalosporin hydroxylase family protein [Pseudomonadota bacterium]